jgi:hypothetical protein
MAIRIILVQLLMVLGLNISAFAANHYICPAATGNHSGADWTNAYTGIGTARGNISPRAMVRGDTYYVANGQITPASSQTEFTVADRETSTITILKAIDGANGTNTGWTNGGTGTCNSSQAVFGPLLWDTDNWVFNGVTRSTSTGDPQLDWRNHESYGFYVNNNNGSNAAVNATGAITIGRYYTDTPTPAHDVTLKFFEVNGSHNGGSGCDENAPGKPSTTDSGVYANAGQSYNLYIGYYYIHDVGTAAALQIGGTGTGIGKETTIEYGWLQNNCSTKFWHGALTIFKAYNGSADNGLILRYNYFENGDGTSYIDTASGENIHPSNWDIYGNVFFYNASEAYPGQKGNGDGVIILMNFTTFGGFFHFYNNTVSSIDRPGGACNLQILEEPGGVSMGTVEIYNNLFYGCSQNIAPLACPSKGCTSFTWGYNSYFGMPQQSRDSSAHVQVASSKSPFVAVGQSRNQNNFALISDTAAWTPLASPYNGDVLGKTRTSSRGAFQCGAQADQAHQGNKNHRSCR